MSPAPDPHELGNPWYDAYHALASYLQVRDFDIVHDHSGIAGPVCGALLQGKPPVVHTLHGPWTDQNRPLYSLLAKHLHLVAISDAQRAANLDVPYAGTVHNGIDLSAYKFRADKEARSCTSDAPTPTRDRPRRSGSRGAPACRCSCS